MGGYLHFFDSQLGASNKFEVGTAAVAQCDRTVDSNSRAALATSCPSRGLDDLERGADKRSSVCRDIEAEADRIGNHARKFADLQQYPSYLGITDPGGYRLNDTLGDREFVHHQKLAREVWMAFPINSISPRAVKKNVGKPVCWRPAAMADI
jgi:hypothetical protein